MTKKNWMAFDQIFRDEGFYRARLPPIILGSPWWGCDTQSNECPFNCYCSFSINYVKAARCELLTFHKFITNLTFLCSLLFKHHYFIRTKKFISTKESRVSADAEINAFWVVQYNWDEQFDQLDFETSRLMQSNEQLVGSLPTDSSWQIFDGQSRLTWSTTWSSINH